MQNTSKLNKTKSLTYFVQGSSSFRNTFSGFQPSSNYANYQKKKSMKKNLWLSYQNETTMNLFRGRRSSTSGASNHTEAGSEDLEHDDASSPSLLSGARSSLCRVFLPRSRTTTSCNLASNSTVASNASSSQYNTNYFDQKSVGNNATSISASSSENYCRRTASLSRNLTRRSRSVTMPNIEQQAHPTLSTFKAWGHFVFAQLSKVNSKKKERSFLNSEMNLFKSENIFSILTPIELH